jgi:hypothetical protein
MKKEKLDFSTLDLYRSLQPHGINSYAPRRGYYYVLQTTKIILPGHVYPVDFAKAIWKLAEEENFNPVNIVEIQLESFKHNVIPNSDKILKNLVGKTVSVSSSFITMDAFNKRKFICNWKIHNEIEDEYLNQSIDEPTIDEVIFYQIEEAELLDIELANTVLDIEEAFIEMDNFESNMFLDMEEHQISLEGEQEAEFTNSNSKI